MTVKKYLDLVGLGEYHGQLKTKWFDKLDAVVNDNNQVINTTVLSGTPTPAAGTTLANTDVIASNKWVLNEISGITEPMIFKGSVSISGTTLTFNDGITEIKTGYTFKFTENSGNFKAGDVIIVKNVVTVDTTGEHPTAAYNVNDWTLVPAGAVASSATEGTVSANLGTVEGSVDNGVLVNSNGVLGIATISSAEIINIVTPSSGT